MEVMWCLGALFHLEKWKCNDLVYNYVLLYIDWLTVKKVLGNRIGLVEFNGRPTYWVCFYYNPSITMDEFA